jgi:hypothetical protein
MTSNFTGISNAPSQQRRLGGPGTPGYSETPETGPFTQALGGGTSLVQMKSRNPLEVRDTPEAGKLSLMAVLQIGEGDDARQAGICRIADGSYIAITRPDDGAPSFVGLDEFGNRPTRVTLDEQHDIEVTYSPVMDQLSIFPGPSGQSAPEVQLTFNR